MNTIHLLRAIQVLSPGAEWKMNDEDLDTLEWLTEGNHPTKEEILKEIKNQEKLELQKIEEHKAAKVSAVSKLIALGLTEDEIAAL